MLFDLRDAVVSKECRAKADEITVFTTVRQDPDRLRMRNIVGVTFVYDDLTKKENVHRVNAAKQTEQAALASALLATD